MRSRFLLIMIFSLLFQVASFAQEEEGIEKESKKEKRKREAAYKPLDPVAPSRAAFYTTIVPGLGQIYNKKYWKVPLVYAGIGIPVYFWADNQRNYDRYRNEYKNRLQGKIDQTDETLAGLDDQRLLDGQNFYRKNRDLSVVIAVGFYVLSIVDANVDAHLMQFNVNENLTIKPVIELDQKGLIQQQQYQYAINVQYRF
ncbi:DUF5683 domain-containing protein [Myroides sp. mNGS23_01]|nr:DUF5683 domain-containing protein [Myroides sp. mNGS23_01]WHT40109.1 DUF5683 domain-containing protein [Myroides sp. mNGS23_01]